ncbi:hypothetical protein EDEG_01418 [Edhazardia aedis USNM 41457]|uniref:Uncharacterized protein n=1 Tax=Edhazardia aedis (strain USNM 41457) TaxID=1003232 RepID=J9D969_EDHAE|nr:hypothetical protein EDEG_01418 [Edhazardia aedis USNM 41457]|eukprot:EJW04321.1 hypothetical protein EDEG_01418 [Edhazardia aedis USNM 41457]
MADSSTNNGFSETKHAQEQEINEENEHINGSKYLSNGIPIIDSTFLVGSDQRGCNREIDNHDEHVNKDTTTSLEFPLILSLRSAVIRSLFAAKTNPTFLPKFDNRNKTDANNKSQFKFDEGSENDEKNKTQNSRKNNEIVSEKKFYGVLQCTKSPIESFFDPEVQNLGKKPNQNWIDQKPTNFPSNNSFLKNKFELAAQKDENKVNDSNFSGRTNDEPLDLSVKSKIMINSLEENQKECFLKQTYLDSTLKKTEKAQNVCFDQGQKNKIKKEVGVKNIGDKNIKKVKGTRALSDFKNEFKYSLQIIDKYYPNFKCENKAEKIYLNGFFSQKLNTFDIETAKILDHAKKITESLQNKTLFDEKNGLKFIYKSILEIFVCSDSLNCDIIQLKPFWLMISLFYPETLRFVRLIRNSFLNLDQNNFNNIKRHNNYVDMKLKFAKSSMSSDKNNMADNIYFSYIKTFNIENISFFDATKNFLYQIKNLLQIIITRKEVEYLNIPIFHEKILEYTLSYNDILIFQRKIKEHNLVDIFLPVILSLPDEIITQDIKILYGKFCFLHKKHPLYMFSYKSDFYEILKMYFSFELPFFIHQNFEYHINCLLKIFNSTPHETFDFGQDQISEFKTEQKRFYQFIYRIAFPHNIKTIFTSYIEQLAFINGIRTDVIKDEFLKIESSPKHEYFKSNKIFLNLGDSEITYQYSSASACIKSISYISMLFCLLKA